MRILKDKTFDRKIAFNIVQRVKFIVISIDKYFELQFIDLVVGESNNFQLQATYQFGDVCGMKIKTIDDGIYKVMNEKRSCQFV